MVAEGGDRENPLPFSLTVSGVGGGGKKKEMGGGGGGVGGVSRLRFPPRPHLRSSRFSRHPRLRQAPARRFAKKSYLWGKGPRPLVGRAPSPGGPGPKPPGDLAHRPLGPGSPLSPVDFLQAKFLTSCCVSNSWVRVSKRYHNPQSADLGGPWMVSEGGAVQLQHFSCWAGPQAPENLANKPLSPASRSRIPKMPRCSSAHEKPGLLHRLISCAQSLQPSLPFLLRRNNKVQGARS